MKKQIFKFLSAFILMMFMSSTVYAGHKIAWLKASNLSNFWSTAQAFVLAAAKDLDVDVEFFEYGENPVLMQQMLKSALEDEKKRPDCVLFHNYKNKGKALLELCEKYKVNAFVFNSGFKDDDNVGKPRENYKYWIGQMLPDDEYAGYLLANQLIQAAAGIDRKSKDGKIHMVALEGQPNSEASNARTRGLKRALQKFPNVVNHQFFKSLWKEKLASEAFKLSVIRYPDVSMFWTASDSMAIGVIKAAEAHKWEAGKDFVTGGIDLLPVNQQYLESGQMSVSVGGHYAEGAWAVIAIIDYLNGHDFAPHDGVEIQTRMFAHSAENYQKIGNLSRNLAEEELDRVDFKRYSRSHNPDLKKYEFKFETLFQQQ